MSRRPLFTLWSMPASPFGVAKGNTACDVRYDVGLLREIVPATSAQGRIGDHLYLRYGG